MTFDEILVDDTLNEGRQKINDNFSKLVGVPAESIAIVEVAFLPALPNDDFPAGTIVYFDGKLYKNASGTWRPVVAASELDGDIQRTQLANNLVEELNKIGKLAKTIGVKTNHSSFGVVNSGEAYVHGFDENSDAADVDASILYQGEAVAITDRTLGTNVPNQLGFIYWTGSFLAFRWKEGNQWKQDQNNGSVVDVSVGSDDLLLGFLRTGAGDEIIEGGVFQIALHPDQISGFASVDQITEASVSAYIAAGAITADQIKANTITAKNIILGNAVNLMQNATVDRFFSDDNSYGLPEVVKNGLNTVRSPGNNNDENEIITGWRDENSFQNEFSIQPIQAFFGIDLGDVYDLEKLLLYWYADDLGNRQYYYSVSVSEDGTNFDFLFGSQSTFIKSDAPGAGIQQDTGLIRPTAITVKRPVRYIRIYGNGNTANSNNHLYEVEAYEANRRLTADNFLPDSIGVRELQADSITAGKIAANAVTASKILVDGDITIRDGRENDGRLVVKDAGNFDQVVLGSVSGKPGVPSGTQYGLWGALGSGVYIQGAPRFIDTDFYEYTHPSKTVGTTFDVNYYRQITLKSNIAVPSGKKWLIQAAFNRIRPSTGDVAIQQQETRAIGYGSPSGTFTNILPAGTYSSVQLAISVDLRNFTSSSRSSSLQVAVTWTIMEVDA